MRERLESQGGATGGGSGVEFEVGDAIQTIRPPGASERCEGIAFSSSGGIMAVASPDTGTVFFFRRTVGGLFEDTPYWRICGADSQLNYPHDVSFSHSGEPELLAVAQRAGAITLYAKNPDDDSYGPTPVFDIRGSKTRLSYSDGVAFLPPDDAYLAVCNLEHCTISFYRRTSRSPLSFKTKPSFELRHRSLADPDGLAFSGCGRWLAVANHGQHSVSIFRRRNRLLSGGRLRYGPSPITVIEDPGLRHPHSVAFSPETNRLVVTNAGANYFSVFAPTGHDSRMRWSRSPALQKTMGPEAAFHAVNARNQMEGGPKGIAIHRSTLAICSPEHGVKLYSLREPARPGPT
jgi:DNA-binding beta-propeller fold protein YncE